MKKVKQSFTLVEILVVIVIIGILSSFIFFTVNDSVEKANLAKTKMFEEAIRNNLLMNLVSEWKFDGSTNVGLAATSNDVKDSWGDNNGTVNGNPKVRGESDCISGKCLEFDGDNDYISMGNSDFFNLRCAGTISFWIKQDSVFYSNYEILQKDNDMGWGSGTDGYKIYNHSEGFHALCSNSAPNQCVIGENPASCCYTTSVDAGKWTYYVWSWNYDSVDLKNSFFVAYKNFKLLGNDRKPVANVKTVGDLEIGRCGNTTVYWQGKIDEFKIYSSVIPESQIKQEYLAGLNNLYAKGLITQLEYNEKLAKL